MILKKHPVCSGNLLTRRRSLGENKQAGVFEGREFIARQRVFWHVDRDRRKDV